jgi:hypothetical protein
VLGVAPGAAHRAARQADEEGAAAGVHPLSLEGVEGLDHRQGWIWQGRVIAAHEIEGMGGDCSDGLAGVGPGQTSLLH